MVTGVLDSLMRPDAEDLIRRHGGKVTQSVSGKTTFLLAGHNAGRSKYRTVGARAGGGSGGGVAGAVVRWRACCCSGGRVMP